MKLMAMAILVAGAAYAAHSEESHDVTVYVDGAATVPLKNLAPAEGIASEIFRQIGVRVAITSMMPGDRTPVRNRMTVRITSHCNAPTKDAVAYAYPFDGSTIVVCYDRLAWAEKSPILPPKLLAHVLVHEITHNLQGFPQHSESGIMKAHWDATDYADMERHPLSFTPEDVRLIETGLKLRSNKLALAPTSFDHH